MNHRSLRSRSCRRSMPGLRSSPKVHKDGAKDFGRAVVRLRLAIISALAIMCLAPSGARAQISDDVVRMGVLNDQSGLYADLGGPGSVTAARMAVEDAGGEVLGKPVEIVFADHQNKADIGVAVARRWFESGKVDMAIGFDNSSVA